VQGRLNTESSDDRKSGEKRYRTSVVAEKLVILSNGNGNARKNQGPDGEPLKREPGKQKMNAKERLPPSPMPTFPSKTPNNEDHTSFEAAPIPIRAARY
jgi:single-stranded DNA-binding protein